LQKKKTLFQHKPAALTNHLVTFPILFYYAFLFSSWPTSNKKRASETCEKDTNDHLIKTMHLKAPFVYFAKGTLIQPFGRNPGDRYYYNYQVKTWHNNAMRKIGKKEVAPYGKGIRTSNTFHNGKWTPILPARTSCGGHVGELRSVEGTYRETNPYRFYPQKWKTANLAWNRSLPRLTPPEMLKNPSITRPSPVHWDWNAQFLWCNYA